jgi:hypothetical protein
MLSRLLQRHTKLHGLLEGEAVGSYGQGAYDPFQPDPVEARALSSSLWEFSALLQHTNKEVARAAHVTAGIGDGTSTPADLPYCGVEPHDIVEQAGDCVELIGGCMPAARAKASCNNSGKRSKLTADKKLRLKVACQEDSPVVSANICCYLGTEDAQAECSRAENQRQVDLVAEELQSIFGCVCL